MTKRKKSKIKSACCKAEIRYSDPAPDFIGDDSKTMQIGTCCAICSKCGKPCNFYVPIRRTWKRNPATKVKGDDRAKKEVKLTKKEIEEFKRNEDF
jgi:L-lactate utilization protein LutB